MRERRIARIYHREMFAAIALYAVLLMENIALAAAIMAGLTFTCGFSR